MYEIRTDLALEDQEKYEADNVEIKGVRLSKQKMGEDIVITTMSIDTENGAKAMGRPRGSYVTIEASSMDDDDEAYHQSLAKKLAEIIQNLLPKQKVESVLVVGLGNRNVTSDSLGPKVADQIFITRHMMREFGTSIFGEKQKQVSAIVPGVMAQTGMERTNFVRKIVADIRRNRRAGSVAKMRDNIARHFFPRNFQFVRQLFHHELVGLVKQKPVDFFLRLARCPQNILNQRRYIHLHEVEHLTALHHDIVQ